MPEIVINLHMHTVHSDGTGTHQEIAEAALQAGLDAVIVTDHNLLVKDQEGYYGAESGERTILLLTGEEIHDTNRVPEKNHLLVFGAEKELAGSASQPQKLISAVNKAGGLSFLAHPTDPAAPLFNQGDYSWEDWDVRGFTGIELWNGLSEFKTRLGSKQEAIWYAFHPKRVARGPLRETLEIWDRLTSRGEKIVAVGGSDAHALSASLGPIRRTLFPYLFHFQAINTHLILPQNLTGDLGEDKKLVYQALRNGHCFVGYDLPHPTRGFLFKATGKNQTASMGDEITLNGAITLQITLPHSAECILIRDGKMLKDWKNREVCSYTAKTPGVYRVEAYLPYKGLGRGWIFSNPIYIRERDNNGV